jgi:hypothetical protein
MKNGLKVFAIAAAALLVAGSAFAAVDLNKPSLTPNGGSLPPVGTQPVAQAVSGLVPDGDFEFGPGGGQWAESAGTPCTWVLNPTSVWGIGANSGFYAFWAGGYCGGVPNNNSVHQVLTVPVGTTDISMYNVFYRPSAEDFDGDRMEIRLGFKLVSTVGFDIANDTYPSWVLSTFPVPAQAGGATVALKVKGHSFGTLTGNALVDDVSINP